MKILLTGHKGFIGNFLYSEIKSDKNNEIITVDKDDGENLCDEHFVNNLPDVDVIFHLAAFNGTKFFYTNPKEVCLNNTFPTINLVKRYSNTSAKFVFASTCEIFNSSIDIGNYPVPTDERVPIMFNDILNPRWSYSIPKALGENLVANSFKNWIILRYFNIYGPNQKDHFLPEFIKRAENNEFTIYGNDTRSFCFVEDAAKITYMLSKLTTNKIINVGRDDEVKIKDVAEKVLHLMGKDPKKLKILDGKKGSASRRCPDTRLLKSIIGDYNFINLDQGLEKTI